MIEGGGTSDSYRKTRGLIQVSVSASVEKEVGPIPEEASVEPLARQAQEVRRLLNSLTPVQFQGSHVLRDEDELVDPDKAHHDHSEARVHST